jgi:hypothetical protein
LVSLESLRRSDAGLGQVFRFISMCIYYYLNLFCNNRFTYLRKLNWIFEFEAFFRFTNN